jgi:hypothetical protein
MKFVHDIQPIGSHNAKLGHTIDPASATAPTQFPCCRTQVEMQTHMLHCLENRRRKQILIAFNKKCKRLDGNWFLPIIADLIGKWLADSTLIPTFDECRDTFLRHKIVPLAYSALVQQAILEQTTIGWIYAVRGFLSKSWHTLASSSLHCDCKQASRQQDGGNRLQQALTALHFLSTELWLGRNEAVHGHKQHSILCQQTLVDAAITRYHCEPDLLVLHDDLHYCTQSLARLLRSSSSIKRRWLHRVKASRLKKASALTRQPRITTHFKSIANSSATDANHRSQTNIRVQRSSNPSSRNVTVQRLMTFFFRERAPNHDPMASRLSPPPQHNSCD